MQVFISHAHADAALAKKIAGVLIADGMTVWNEEEILPGDNWAEKTAQALKDSEAMVVLLTPSSLNSRTVRREIEYALGDESYSHRLVPVVVGNPEDLPNEKFPWILKRLKVINLPEQDATDYELKQVADVLKAKA